MSWDSNYSKLGRYNKYPFDYIISLTKKYIKNHKINALDAGCGVGNHTKFLQDEKFNVFAVDSSKTAIKMTKNLVKKKFHNQIICDDLRSVAYKDSFFDLIIDQMSITHNLEKDVEIIIDNMHRILKKDSIFITSFHSVKNPNLKYGKKNGNNYDKFKKGSFKYSDIVFASNYKTLKKKFTKFEILDFKEIINYNLLKNKIESSFFTIVLKKI